MRVGRGGEKEDERKSVDDGGRKGRGESGGEKEGGKKRTCSQILISVTVTASA